MILFQRLLGSGGDDTLAIQASLFILPGLATLLLLRLNAPDRDLIASPGVVPPLNVTLVCSHPGLIATGFPKEAKLAVIYRDDDVGIIDDTMAAEIVEAVGHTSSLVWVDEDGFRVAPSR